MNKLTLAKQAADSHRLKALGLDSVSSPINASGRLSDPSGTISTTARAATRQVLTEMVPQDAVSRGTGAARGLAGTTAPLVPGAAATAAPTSSPDQFER